MGLYVPVTNTLRSLLSAQGFPFQLKIDMVSIPFNRCVIKGY